jgi:hypothetical protein
VPAFAYITSQNLLTEDPFRCCRRRSGRHANEAEDAEAPQPRIPRVWGNLALHSNVSPGRLSGGGREVS